MKEEQGEKETIFSEEPGGQKCWRIVKLISRCI